MPTFGFSAYLKLISLSERSRRSEIRKRLQPSEGGYDFHRSLKSQSAKFLAGQPLEEALAAADSIIRSAERNSVKIGLANLNQWRLKNPGLITSFQPSTYESPSSIFSVVYTPNFGIKLGEFNKAIHIWNTKRPPLTPRQIYSALSLFRDLYQDKEGAPDDIGVLSLINSNAYRLGEASDYSEISQNQVLLIEENFREISKEIGVSLPSRRIIPPAPPGARL